MKISDILPLHVLRLIPHDRYAVAPVAVAVSVGGSVGTDVSVGGTNRLVLCSKWGLAGSQQAGQKPEKRAALKTHISTLLVNR